MNCSKVFHLLVVDLLFDSSSPAEGKEEQKGFFGSAKEFLVAHLLKVVEVSGCLSFGKRLCCLTSVPLPNSDPSWKRSYSI